MAEHTDSHGIEPTRQVAVGETIFSDGEEGDCAYIIESGRVEIFIEPGGAKVPITTLGPRQIFGEMAIIDGSPRSATVVALEPTVLMSVTREALSERIERSDPVVRLLVTMLIERIRAANKEAAHRRGIATAEPSVDVGEAPGEPAVPHESALEKMRLEAGLREALIENEFELRFQPIVELQTGRVAGFEALIRWESESRGTINPGEFMGVAEETSLIVPIGKWVIETSCDALARLIEGSADGNRPFMSINFSGRQLQDVHFLEHLEKTIDATGLEATDIMIEVTERVMMEGPTVYDALQRIRDLGVLLALDDFGTGYSSLTSFCEMAVDMLKIERAFVGPMLEEKRAHAVTRAVIEMARDVGANVIAEGVEDADIGEELKSLGCEYAQGWHYGKPLSADDALARLHD